MRYYPEDEHKLPRMEGNYICFPDWCHRLKLPGDALFRLCAWIGETFNDGRYCFTVSRNKPDGSFNLFGQRVK